ncbi:MAG: YkvA family protein [Planctomycetota bacterium]
MSDVRQSQLLGKAKAKAAEYLKDPSKLRGLASKASATATALGQDGPLAKIWEDLTVLFRLLGHIYSGTYSRFPTRSLLLVIAGLLYFVWPVDLVPDAILMFGWLDDVALLAFIIRSVRLDLEAFQLWEKTAATMETEQTICLN